MLAQLLGSYEKAQEFVNRLYKINMPKDAGDGGYGNGAFEGGGGGAGEKYAGGGQGGYGGASAGGGYGNNGGYGAASGYGDGRSINVRPEGLPNLSALTGSGVNKEMYDGPESPESPDRR
ncbi:hypothetical protein RvY_06011-3 [Ramazzottius varieornatus]|nr:hypothetical protein RvY_06011-3 [Ramazzottius varieornatus]